MTKPKLYKESGIMAHTDIGARFYELTLKYKEVHVEVVRVKADEWSVTFRCY